MNKIKEFFQSLVNAGTIPQEPMNYDAATLKIYIDYLEAENAALRERLEKMEEVPYKMYETVYYVYRKRDKNLEYQNWEIIKCYILAIGIYGHTDMSRDFNYGITLYDCDDKEDPEIRIFGNDFSKQVFSKREAAEAYVAKLEGGKK